MADRARPRVLLWLYVVADHGDAVTLSSDFALCRLNKTVAIRRPCGRWSIPCDIAVDRCLIEGAT